MAKKKQQERKKKAKERATYQQKVKKRLFASRRARYEREMEKEAAAGRTKLEPIRRNTHLEKVSQALNRNLEVLRALEEEYVREQMARADINAELEAEGFKTVEEKMEALKNKARAIAQTIQNELKSAT
jgi:preprotein translocase subunit SecA